MFRSASPDGPRRQWGGDRRKPLPVVPPRASDGTIALGQLAIVLTVVGWIVFVLVTLLSTSLLGGAGKPPLDAASIGYVVIMSLLACSAIAYLTTRLGYYTRTRSHRRAPRSELGAPFEEAAPTLTVLVPSYQEDERVNRMTLLSAALQEYPDLEIVLLVDDPPEPRFRRPATMLAASLRLPAELEALLGEPGGRARAALERFDQAFAGGRAVATQDLRDVAGEYLNAARWLGRQAEDYEVVDHADRFLVDQVLGRLASELNGVHDALHEAVEEEADLSARHLRHLLLRLTWIFGVRITSFQRKRYVSLSHEPNKAMNLNSYIGLMGGRYCDVPAAGGRALVPARAGEPADLVVRDPDYVLTLDADSLLLPEYCLRLVHLLEQREHERVAVAQAPYSAFPGAATRLERIAGATTDLQYLVHQGMTYYDATFWVGANAVLRKAAMDDLCEVEHVGDWEIRRYVSDRTVIEDTESSMDLAIRGWKLLNYPERLSYSATPPDFGSLCIQRQRWANGGLIILPRLWEQLRARRARGEKTRFGEVCLRINYMASIFWSSLALLILLAAQFDDNLLSPVVLLISVPYFVMMSSDLKHCGYRRTDVLRIYGFNLVLLPVNLAGAGASLVQALVGSKPAFKRTPKVRSRTTPSLMFVVLPFAFVGFSVATLLLDIERERWVNAALAATNATLSAYAIVAYIGLRHSVVDVFHNVLNWLYRPSVKADRVPIRRRRRGAATGTSATPHWSDTLAYVPPEQLPRPQLQTFAKEQV